MSIRFQNSETIELENTLTELENIELLSKRHLTFEGLISFQEQFNNLHKKKEKKKVAKVCLVLK